MVNLTNLVLLSILLVYYYFTMHLIQQKILKLLDAGPIENMSLREIGERVGASSSPQQVKHHLEQLATKGFLRIDKKRNRIEKTGSALVGGLIALPIMGSANCGEATFFADDHIEGYLHVTKSVLGALASRIKDLFVLRAVGPSMNRAQVAEETIEDGDYVVIDKSQRKPTEGRCVVSVIAGVANIKKLHVDTKRQQIVLISESNQNLPPIYVHPDDLDDYLIAGTVVKVMKQPNEEKMWQDAAGADSLKHLGKQTKEEYTHYMNL